MNDKMSTLQEKAKILIDGGIVVVSGMRVILRHEPGIFDTCAVCDMDYLCHFGTELHLVCRECDSITGEDCILIPFV